MKGKGELSNTQVEEYDEAEGKRLIEAMIWFEIFIFM